MPTIPQPYLRGLQLEGRHPADAGIWGVTLSRMMFGEGLPAQDDPLHDVPIDPEGPLPEPPEIPESRRYTRNFYRRIRSLEECITYLQTVAESVAFATEIFPSFMIEHGGHVPMPGPAEQPLPDTHAITVYQPLRDSRVLPFPNTWGTKWGDRGWGYLPFDYFNKYVFECWGHEYRPQFRFNEARRQGPYRVARWTHDREFLPRCYGFEVLKWEDDQRLGWSFVVERDGALEIEELYVRPEFRGRGIGRLLVEGLRDLFRVKRGVVRLWVPFADCRSESERTYDALLAVSRRLGLVFHPSPVRWAAYLATNRVTRESSDVPIEPAWIPSRPRSPFEAALLAATIALSPARSLEKVLAPVQAEISTPSLTGGKVKPVPDWATSPAFPDDIEVGTSAWEAMNERRAELIDLKVRAGYENMDPNDREEYDRLQYISQKAIERAFPGPFRDDPDIRRLKEILAGQSGIDDE